MKDNTTILIITAWIHSMTTSISDDSVLVMIASESKDSVGWAENPLIISHA